jgi:hypothetical protein
VQFYVIAPEGIPMEGKSKMEGMGMGHVDPVMMAIWHKADDATKKMWTMRMLDEKIMMKEFWIKHMQHKVETMKMLKSTIEKMK